MVFLLILLAIIKLLMSFLVRVGDAKDNDQKLAVVRKKYFHNILQFNQQSQREKKEQNIIERQKTNLKIAQINQSALQQLEYEATIRKQQKIMQQQILKEQYQRQIRDRKQRYFLEREGDKRYLRLQQIETEKASQRRLADLLKIYDRAAVKATHLRTKTEADDANLETSLKGQQNQQSYKRIPFLPAIERIHATSTLKNRPQPAVRRSMKKSQISLSVLNPS